MLDRRKEAMIMALWSNPNLDDDKGTRKNAIEEIEHNYEEAVWRIWHPEEAAEEDKIDHDNPFFQAADRGMARIQKPIKQGGTVQEVIDYGKYQDQ
jgi:hypothetical protein